MLALVGTVLSRSASGNVLLRDGDGVLGTHSLTSQVLISCTGYIVHEVEAPEPEHGSGEARHRDNWQG